MFDPSLPHRLIVPDTIADFAAQAAANELIEHWQDCIADGWELKQIIGDLKATLDLLHMWQENLRRFVDENK